MDRHVAFVFFFGNIQINWMLKSELLDGGSNCPAAEWQHTDIDLLLLFNGVPDDLMGGLRGVNKMVFSLFGG